MALWDIYLSHTGRKIVKWSHYFPVYETYFQKFVNTPVVFIEIGVYKGGSLQMWKKYFGPHAKIIGIDIRPEFNDLEEEQIYIRTGDQNDPAFLQSLVDEFGTPNIVLDDGSHNMLFTTTSFNTLYPKLSDNGVYIIEDAHTAYWEEYGGGLKKPDSIIEVSKHLIDELNANHTRGALPATDFTRTTSSISFYDSMIAFQRGTFPKPYTESM